jgi:hypothetical protein
LSSEEVKVCTTRKAFRACSAKIVKRRLIWRLPGLGFDRKVKPKSEAGPYDVVDGLADRTRKRGQGRKEACHSGRLLLVFLWNASDGLIDDRCLTARSRI